MFGRYSILARQAVMVARLEAGLVGADQIDSEHLLIAVMSVHPELPKLLNASIELSQLREQCDRWHTPSSPILKSRDLPLTADLRRVFKRVESIADGRQCPEIRTEHLLLSMAEEPCHAAQLLADCGVSEEPLLALLANVKSEVPQLGTAASIEAMKSIFDVPPAGA